MTMQKMQRCKLGCFLIIFNKKTPLKSINGAHY